MDQETRRDLAQMRCEACRKGAPTVPDKELETLLAMIPEWTLVDREQIKRLEKVFKFGGFPRALEFANRVGALAESEGHHPSLLTEWGRVTVTWWTHKIKGLHLNDFIMAAKTDKLAIELMMPGR